jgi:hypothetical protein
MPFQLLTGLNLILRKKQPNANNRADYTQRVDSLSPATELCRSIFGRQAPIYAQRTTIGFKIKILGRPEGGRRTRRTLTTDNASKIFILKPIRVRIPNPHTGDIGKNLLKQILREAGIGIATWEKL